MKKSQHFLMTKFNQAMIGGDRKVSSLHNSSEWLRKRFALFGDYCLPSVMGQNNQNFAWLVFFDSNTPNEFRSTILSFKRDFPKFIPIFTDGIASEIGHYKIEIERYLKDDTEVLITTRFDSDDALNASFIDYIHRNIVDNKADYFINFTYGFQYDILHNVLCRSKQSSNPFLTRIELINDGTFKTVLQLSSHKDAKNLHEVIDLSKKDMWLQIVHGDNLANSLGLRRLPLISSRTANSEFCLNKSIHISFVKCYSFYIRKIFLKLLMKKRSGKHE